MWQPFKNNNGDFFYFIVRRYLPPCRFLNLIKISACMYPKAIPKAKSLSFSIFNIALFEGLKKSLQYMEAEVLLYLWLDLSFFCLAT